MTWGYVFFAFVLLPAAFLAYLWLGIWSVRGVARTALPMFAKGPAVVLLIAILMAVPFGDEIVGRYRLAELCKTATIKIHRVVTLDSKYMSPEGWPRYELVLGPLGLRRYVLHGTQEEISAWLKITKKRYEVRDEVAGDTLVETVSFDYGGGWLGQWLPGHSRGASCPGTRERSMALSDVFQPGK